MRLFVAIELSLQARSALRAAQDALRPRSGDVRWTPPEQLHLTAKFLGEVPDGQARDVAEAITRAATASMPFNMSVGGCGCFPPRGAVRIVWAGADEPTGALPACIDAVESELADLGFERERRPFSPHITIGRVKEDRSAGRLRSLVEKHELPPVLQPVATLTLMSSVLSPKGAQYTAVKTARLGNAGPTTE